MILALMMAVVAVLGVSSLEAQPTQLSVAAPAPPPVSQNSCRPFGVAGGTTLYYYVIARYPSGLAFPSSPVTCPNTVGLGNMTAANGVVVSWSPPASQVTGYDVVVFSSPLGNPQSCVGCAIVLNTTATSFTHNSSTTFAYPPAGLNVATATTATILIDNLSQALPALNILIPPFTYQNVMLLGPITPGNLLKAAPNGPPGAVVDGGVASVTGLLSVSGSYLTDGTSFFLPSPALHKITKPFLVSGGSFITTQGTATISDVPGGGLFMTDSTGGVSMKVFGTTTPATPYTITADFVLFLEAAPQQWTGLALMAGTGAAAKIIQYGYVYNGGSRLQVTDFTNQTLFSANELSTAEWQQGFISLRISDTGTNRIFLHSFDGVNYTQDLSTVNTNFLTADHIGFVVNSAAPGKVSQTILNYTVTSP